MSQQHKHGAAAGHPGAHIRVKATTTFKMYLDGHEEIQFMRDQIHPRPFTKAQMSVYLTEKQPRLIEVTPAMLKAIDDAQAAKNKAMADAQAAELAAKDKNKDKKGGNGHSSDGQGSSGGAAGAELPDAKELEGMNKGEILAQAEAEGVEVAETQSKAQIKEAILGARSAV